MFNFNIPTKICFGAGQLEKMETVIPNGVKTILYLSAPEMEKIQVITDAYQAIEKKFKLIKYAEIIEEPTCEMIDQLAEKFSQFKVDLIIAVGGGSVIDTGKALGIRLNNPNSTWDYVNLSNKPPVPLTDKVIPVIAVPTTAGTGSEATPYAVLKNKATNQKGTIKEEKIFPLAAILDPRTLVTLPPTLTAATGVDAFAHALESLMNRSNRNAMTDMIATEAIKCIMKWLRVAVTEGDNLEAREQVMLGSLLAGIAIANAGTTVAHALAQPLGTRANISHSLAVAMFTLPVLKHSLPEGAPILSNLFRAIKNDCGTLSDENAANRFIQATETLFAEVGVLQGVVNHTYPENLEEALLGDILGYMRRPLQQHIRMFDETDLKEIIKDAVAK